ncbi:MAG: glutamine amidotransferase [Myxococcota bacterium]
MGEPSLWILKTGSTFPALAERRGDFDAWIAAGMALPPGFPVAVAQIDEGQALPPVADCRGVVITGSAAMVSDREPWSEAAIDWLGAVLDAEVPCLGICYGHQMLARAAGAAVGPNPNGREIGTVEVAFEGHAEDPLLSVLPPRAALHTTHVESVLEPPPGARLLATTALDPYHAFALGERAWGVQFHPEFDEDVMRCYLRERRAPVAAEGLDPDALLAAVAPAPLGTRLLKRFAELL